MITILKQMIFNMSRKKCLTESIEDFGKQIVNNVYDTLIQWNYDQGEIDSIVGRDSIELDIENGECVLHCGNEIIYSTPSNVLIHKFAPAAEDALLNWCIKKIGREPERIDADDLFSDVPGWNSLNEAYGTDFEDTLTWVQKKFPNKSEKEQHQFAKNIMKRYVTPDETNSTDVVEKPKTRKNVKLIKIVDIPNHGRHQDVYCKSLLLRTARKPGDTERVNHTVLGRLNAAGVKYEIIDENKNMNMNMNKKNTINEARRPANKQVGQHLFKGLRYDSNGNPLYTCDTLSNEEAQAMGWRFSPKYGLYGQLSDPTMFYESKKRSIKLTESELKRVISESVKKILNESDYKVRFALQTINHYYDYAMECFNDPHRGFPKQAVANVIKAAKTLLPYKDQDNDIKNAIIKAKQLSNLAKREVEINRRGQEICDNEGGLAYMDYLDSVGKIPTIEESVKQVISESVNQIISEISWQTRVNAANKARKQVRDRIYQLGAGEIDPNGSYSKISGQYGPYTGREWKKGRKGYTTSRQELKRRLKQADNLSKYADEGIKQEFGPMSYYNDGNGVGKEYPALRRFYNNREIGEKDIVDYYPNKDYVSGEYDDYNLEDMPQGFQRKAKEVNDFQNGNYQYTKGKGWHLKDDK